ncbi:outer membrane protein assembly factor BamD [Hyphomicrobium sp. D-2]|uniref:outer membrane protein assembly factor BamD n=1 Tax=Hyphomicrobium sp. D-2 TaxID=3041621 RepID=UPI002457C3AA|nr:outer membrane protein assembly factor BamD [Hyphomicrobium sp. D-2]MDH4982527.1 outer membrane protein assembly factor BamD [Hyphomicrobium sp. D-2]
MGKIREIGPARRAFTVVSAIAAAAILAACSSNDAIRALNPDPPSKMFADADALMAKGSHESAAKKFEDVDREHPYSPEARRAIVMAAYSYYKAGKTPEAIAAAERYTTMHPGTKEAPLAHHIIAQSYFDQMKTPNRDQDTTRKALAQFKILKARYPDSTYAQKADNQIRLCEDTLAAQEMDVGRYYLNKGNHIAAINRFKTVVTEYQTTAHVEEALYRLSASYLALGIAPEAQNAVAVLGHNFPNSSWYKDSYALLQKQGLMPQVSAGSWMTDVLSGPSKPPAAPPAAAPAPAPAPAAPSVPDWPAATTTSPPPPSSLGGPSS